jgi:hypothetical protein
LPQLSQAEKLAGRAFRDAQQEVLDQLNAAEPPDLTPPPHVHHYRHACAARGGQSVSFEMYETYILSPAMLVTGRKVWEIQDIDATPENPEHVIVPLGRLAFIYREGRCGGCKVLGRTRAWVADASERPPLGRT